MVGLNPGQLGIKAATAEERALVEALRQKIVGQHGTIDLVAPRMKQHSTEYVRPAATSDVGPSQSIVFDELERPPLPDLIMSDTDLALTRRMPHVEIAPLPADLQRAIQELLRSRSGG